MNSSTSLISIEIKSYLRLLRKEFSWMDNKSQLVLVARQNKINTPAIYLHIVNLVLTFHTGETSSGVKLHSDA